MQSYVESTSFVLVDQLSEGYFMFLENKCLFIGIVKLDWKCKYSQKIKKYFFECYGEDALDDFKLN